jgi:fatty acid desaturase
VPANSGPSTPPTPRLRGRATRFAPRALMWAAIGLSVVLFWLFIALGWRDDAGTVAAGLLLLTCLAVCIWAGVQGRISDREVERAVAQMAAAREQDRRRSPSTEATDGG